MRHFLLFALLMACLPATAQRIKFSELVGFCEGGPAAAQRTLLPRGWLYAGPQTFQDSLENCVGESELFGLPLTPPDSTGYGQWINVDTEGSCRRGIGYQTGKKAAITLLIRELKTDYRMAFDHTSTAREGNKVVTRTMYIGPVYRAQLIRTQDKTKKNWPTWYALYVARQIPPEPKIPYTKVPRP